MEPTFDGFFVQLVEPGDNSSFITSTEHSMQLAVHNKQEQQCWKATVPDSINAIRVEDNPTYVILDLGCTRAVGSRVAVDRLLKVAHHYKITHEILPSNSRFNFANSQKSTCTEKCRLWFPTDPPIHTDFDIIEEGNVPLLFSLPQMRNLRFTLELSPEAVFLTSVVFGYKRVRLKASTSNHMVLDH